MRTLQCSVCNQQLRLLETEEVINPPADASFHCSYCGCFICRQCVCLKTVGNACNKTLYGYACPQCGETNLRYCYVGDSILSICLLARDLVAAHGSLKEVRCLDTHKIGLEYQDGTKFDENLGGARVAITCGYAGGGPTHFHLFLKESGFKITRKEIFNKKPPYTLTQE